VTASVTAFAEFEKRDPDGGIKLGKLEGRSGPFHPTILARSPPDIGNADSCQLPKAQIREDGLGPKAGLLARMLSIRHAAAPRSVLTQGG